MEYGPLEPYQGRHPERVYLQGEVRSDGFSLVLESATASLKQSDVLIALLTSDETFELKAVDDCFPPEIMTEAQAADACLDSSHPVFNSLFSHRRCCEKAQAASGSRAPHSEVRHQRGRLGCSAPALAPGPAPSSWQQLWLGSLAS
ncbi:unnamed protein product [Polarella glacialis]|uniref:Uncharacterized protein n=1 Tax=Polarella glacialis TaxID=89957 RepID=A0A813K9N7_POLGL|nr:unnamed protein product [Polarella glacialis]